MLKCYMCKAEKQDEEFAWKKRGEKRNTHCRDCHKAYRKKHYEENRQKYITKASARGVECKKKFYQWLQTQECLDCGNTDFRVLEFDHRDPSTKKGNISRMIASASGERLRIELEKCDVVCANCHRIRSAERGEWYAYLEDLQ